MKDKRAAFIVLGLALVILGLGWRMLSPRRTVHIAKEQSRARSEEYRQSPIAENLDMFIPAKESPPPAPAESKDTSGDWSVVAATLPSTEAAQKRAQALRGTWSECACTVFPNGESEHYFVVVGTNLDRAAADRLRDRAKTAGLPEDTYVTKLINRN